MGKMNNKNYSDFSISYSFFDDCAETELSMLIDGENVLAFEYKGETRTTRWNLDELAFWLRNFLDNMSEDPYPVETNGHYAAEKDITAREFDSEDDDEFDAYYDRLDDWNLRHRWHTASGGGILADIYFQAVGDAVEVSWNNQDAEEEVRFKNQLGGASVKKEQFVNAIENFLVAYADHRFKGNNLNDIV